MKTTFETLEGHQVKITATIEKKVVEDRITRTYKQFAAKYNFPGFRKGKAPRPIIDNALGHEYIMAEVTQDVVDEFYPQTIEEGKLYPTGKPEFGEDMGLVESGKDFTFECTVPVKPELELSSYEPIKVALMDEGASDEEIDYQLETLRSHYFTYEAAAAKTKVANDMRVRLEMTAKTDSGREVPELTTDSFLYGVGSGLLPEDFDKELIGLKVGDKKEFKIALPSEPTAYTTNLVGLTTSLEFSIDVKEVLEKKLPEANDEWAHEVLGYEDMNDLRSRIAESIKAEKEDLIPRLKESQCLTELASRVQGEVPEAMAEDAESKILQDFFKQLQQQGMTFDQYLKDQGITADDFKADAKEQAQQISREDLALDAWARHYDLKATDEEVSEEFAKAGLDNPKKVEEEWRKQGQLYMIRQGIERSKAMNDVLDKAVPLTSAAEAEEKPKKAAKKSTKKADDAAAEEKPAKKPAAKKSTKKTTKKEAE